MPTTEIQTTVQVKHRFSVGDTITRKGPGTGSEITIISIELKEDRCPIYRYENGGYDYIEEADELYVLVPQTSSARGIQVTTSEDQVTITMSRGQAHLIKDIIGSIGHIALADLFNVDLKDMGAFKNMTRLRGVSINPLYDLLPSFYERRNAFGSVRWDELVRDSQSVSADLGDPGEVS